MIEKRVFREAAQWGFWLGCVLISKRVNAAIREIYLIGALSGALTMLIEIEIAPHLFHFLGWIK
jgi:hypothetical protein